MTGGFRLLPESDDAHAPITVGLWAVRTGLAWLLVSLNVGRIGSLVSASTVVPVHGPAGWLQAELVHGASARVMSALPGGSSMSSG